MKDLKNLDSMLVSSNNQGVETCLRISLEKCYYASGYPVNENTIDLIIETLKKEVPALTVDEFISKINKFRQTNEKRISVPIILRLFKRGLVI